MKLTADSQGRLTSTELFTPGSTFDVSQSTEGEIVLRKLQLRRVFARLQHQNGRIVVQLPPGKPADQAIEQAVRAERDSR